MRCFLCLIALSFACDAAPLETDDAGAGDTSPDADAGSDAQVDIYYGPRDGDSPDADAAPEGGPLDAAAEAAAEGGTHAGQDASQDASQDAGPYDLGPQPWEEVPAADVREVCKLDPEALADADALLPGPWAVVRYGKLCHAHRPEGTEPGQVYSVTKTITALVMGLVAHETRARVRDGRQTGPLSDEDRVDHWLDEFDYHPDAQVAHVLAMVAHNESLAFGAREFTYDTVGTVQINTLATMMEHAIAQEPERLGSDLEVFTRRFLHAPLGLAHSEWNRGRPDKLAAFSFSSDVYDMAKIGWLMLRGGVWEGERLLGAEWVYRMTHPAFEDANTGYGYLTWLNATAGRSRS